MTQPTTCGKCSRWVPVNFIKLLATQKRTRLGGISSNIKIYISYEFKITQPIAVLWRIRNYVHCLDIIYIETFYTKPLTNIFFWKYNRENLNLEVMWPLSLQNSFFIYKIKLKYINVKALICFWIHCEAPNLQNIVCAQPIRCAYVQC